MSWAQGQRIFLTLVLLPLMVYIGSFRILCSLADHWGPDTVFVSHQFQTESFWTKFVELNTKMYTLNAGLSKPHQDSSPAHLWPLMCKPVFYWQSMPDASTHNRGYIYMVGNPVLWYGGLAGLLMFLVSWRKIQLPSRVKRLMIAGYFLNWVPFLLVHRVLFLYHYLAAFIFTVILCAFGITVCANQGSSLQRRIIYASSIVAVMVGFLLYAPVSYGLPISKETHDALLGWLVR